MSIVRLAAFLRVLAWLGALVVMMRPLLGWIAPLGPFATVADEAFSAALANSGSSRLTLMSVLFPPFACVAFGLVQLAGFCGHLAREEHFTRAAARSLARLGWAVIAAAVLLPVTRVVALVWLNAFGVWSLIIAALRLPTLMSVTMGLIFGTIIVIFSALLDKSIRLQDENSSFV